MKTVLRLIMKDYRLFWGDKVAVSLTFVIPIILIIIWGAIFGNLGSGSASFHLGFVNKSSSPVAKTIEKALDSSKAFILIKKYRNEQDSLVPLDTSSARAFVMKGNASAALVIPEDAYTDTSVGLKLILYYDPKNDMEMQMIQGLLQKTIFSQMPAIFQQSMQRQATHLLGKDSGQAFNREIIQTVGRYFHINPVWLTDSMLNSGAGPTGEGLKKQSEFFQSFLRIDQIQVVGQNIANPWATRSVGGWAIMFLLFTLTASSSSLFDEKKSGVVLRILAAPITRVQILWGKYLYNMSLGFIQLLVLFTGGCLLYRIDIFSNFLNLALIMLAATSACTAFGMLLAAFSKTAAQANSWGMFLILAMSSVGGAWFPTSFMPGYIQAISKFTIVYWSMDGMLQVLWRGAGTGAILPNLGVLFGAAAVITSISILQFKKGHVF